MSEKNSNWYTLTHNYISKVFLLIVTWKVLIPSTHTQKTKRNRFNPISNPELFLLILAFWLGFFCLFLFFEQQNLFHNLPLGFQFFPPLFFQMADCILLSLFVLQHLLSVAFWKDSFLYNSETNKTIFQCWLCVLWKKLQLRKYQFPPDDDDDQLYYYYSIGSSTFPLTYVYLIPCSPFILQTYQKWTQVIYFPFLRVFLPEFSFFSFSTTWREKTCNKNKQ